MPDLAEIIEPDDRDSEVDRKIEELRDALAQVRQRRRHSFVTRLTWAVVSSLILFVVFRFEAYVWLWMVPMGMFGGETVADIAALRRLRDATREVGRLNDSRTVAILLEARRDRDGITRATALPALKRALPLLRPGDTEWLPAPAIREITSLLGSTDADLSIAALAALEHVGNEDSRRAVETIARLTDNLAQLNEALILSPTLGQWQERMDDVVREARRVAAAMEIRLEAQRQQAVLLRPADNVEQAVLLRPATTNTESPPERLLRPSDTGA